MTVLAELDGVPITCEDFIAHLKFSNQYNDLMDRYIRGRVTVRAAESRGITATPDEVQRAADDFRRCLGLHRARETREWLHKNGITAEAFETLITEHLLVQKLMAAVADAAAVEAYFRSNAPKFETVDLRRMVVEGENKARELSMILDEGESDFESLCREHSLDEETRKDGGAVRGVRRGQLPQAVEEKVFTAAEGGVVGPFRLNGRGRYEIIRVDRRTPPRLDDAAREWAAEELYREWMAERMAEAAVDIH